jgi:hypothetical protein
MKKQKRLRSLVDEIIETAFHKARREYRINGGQLFAVGLGYAAVGLIGANSATLALGYKAICGLFIAMGLVTMVAVRRRI